MKYVIKQTNFAYNDEYYETGMGKTITKIFTDELEAKKALYSLEKEFLNHVHATERATLQIWQDKALQDNWQALVEKLNEFGINIALPNGLFNDEYDYPTDADLKFDQLTDEQLYKVLEVSNSAQYSLIKYDDNKKTHALKFVENGLADEFQGYFVMVNDVDGVENIIVSNSEEALLSQIELNAHARQPIATTFTENDKNNSLVTSLLTQYQKNFVIFEGVIYFIDADLETETAKKALIALNAVLENPFYKICQHTPDEIIAMQNDDAVLKASYRRPKKSKSFERYLKFIRAQFIN